MGFKFKEDVFLPSPSFFLLLYQTKTPIMKGIIGDVHAKDREREEDRERQKEKRKKETV